MQALARPIVDEVLDPSQVGDGATGTQRRLALEDEYWKMIASVSAPARRCRRLRIARTTGYYWRAQRGGLLLRTVLPEDARSGR
ncbi:MAG: hypothetical protein EOP24_28065 [Hyphomicrobiales bacterium]|nr:MAG: hypothetical protein EOP24_28065 [Hyphomicrobiales bacterium]